MLENIYLCGSNNNWSESSNTKRHVVICLKIYTFVVATTTGKEDIFLLSCCDLLENIYLCGSNNNSFCFQGFNLCVVICLKIYTFVVATTTDKIIFIDPKRVVICLKIYTFVVATTTYFLIFKLFIEL